ncbi:SLOG family protein [Streptomyces sp. C8S0]|uniref:SLOG family protein n=1 Tax=Streptomyces sp. C8S0 TaxID=2585716 RepID=UPI00125DFA87|nr:SLOG family protein [Streptomyces sp. C8S0]
MTGPYRILVTGSRNWTDTLAVTAALEQSVIDAGPCPILVVHGACPTGADQHADTHARHLRNRGVSIDVERHPANWRPDGRLDRAAGFRRNAEMVAAGADVCLAFIKGGSRGASHTARLAEQADIPVRRWTS